MTTAYMPLKEVKLADNLFAVRPQADTHLTVGFVKLAPDRVHWEFMIGASGTHGPYNTYEEALHALYATFGVELLEFED